MVDKPVFLLDDFREDRIGFDEAILCEQKTAVQIREIATLSSARGQRRLFTRLRQEKFEQVCADLEVELAYDPMSRTAVLGEFRTLDKDPQVAIVSAGSSDAAVVAEACATLAYYGHRSRVIPDVGVAGIWRLMSRVDEIARMPVVIAVAGMDAALPTVLAGLIPSCVIGVPTSTGYGAARGGETALFAMLSSCAPGLTVSNIDNGYGAACTALRMLRMIEQESTS
jgi:NCAIR mutase (PurE)-related protein